MSLEHASAIRTDDRRSPCGRIGFGQGSWIAIVGLATALPIPFIGNVAPASLALLLVWGFFTVKQPSRTPEVFALSVIGIATIAATFFWVYYAGSTLPVYGIVSTAVFVAVIATLGWLSLSLDKLMLLLASSAVGAAVFYVLVGTALTQQSAEFLWKYGIANFVTVAALVAATWSGRLRVAPLAVLGLAGSVSLVTGFRSHGLVCFAAAVVVVFVGQSISARARLIRLGLVVVVLVLLEEAAKRMILAGVFGAYVQSRAESQEISGVPSILSGRVELPLSYAQITSSPLSGIGNVDGIAPAVIDKAYSTAYAWGLRNTGYFENQWFPAPGNISVHSVFFSTWIEAGIVGALFVGGVLFVVARSFVLVRGKWAPVVAYLAFNTVWDLLFSPWSSKMAPVLGVGVMVLVVARGAYHPHDHAEKSERHS